jgi:hypothetical protein
MTHTLAAWQKRLDKEEARAAYAVDRWGCSDAAERHRKEVTFLRGRVWYAAGRAIQETGCAS